MIEQGLADIAPAGRDVEHEQIRAVRQKPLDGPNAAKPLIDHLQLAVSRIKLMRGLSEIVHNLR